MEEWKFQPSRDLGLTATERLGSLRRESGLIESIGHRIWWAWIGCYLKLFHRMAVRGRENLPAEAPFVLVANHSSHLDVFALASPCPGRLRDRIFPIAAGDAFFEKVPVAAFAAYALNALPLWRRHCDPRDLEEMRRRLTEEPCAYVLFPEGTRSRTGEMGPFRRGIGALVASTLVPVIPCWLEGAFAAFPPQNRFPRPTKLTLRVGVPLRFPATPNDKAGWTEVASQVEAAVRALRPLGPPAGSPPAPSP
ncbi:MAG TPA: lysophospholipid acyltransferase family protein [Planctomycetota bacterium]|nr:lysophospholipid acyltransferase family protein [Planctomycetota bacterium]